MIELYFHVQKTVIITGRKNVQKYQHHHSLLLTLCLFFLCLELAWKLYTFNNYCIIETIYFRIDNLSSIASYAVLLSIIIWAWIVWFRHLYTFSCFCFYFYFHKNCRESKGRKCSLPVYDDDEDSSDLNGFGYRANDMMSGNCSVSEDYENQSVNVSVLIGL